MFTHVIWDWNGTLLDDATACVAAINALLERRLLPQVTHQQYLDIFDFPVRNYYLQLGFDFSKDTTPFMPSPPPGLRSVRELSQLFRRLRVRVSPFPCFPPARPRFCGA